MKDKWTELAAYVGDEPSRVAMGWGATCDPEYGDCEGGGVFVPLECSEDRCKHLGECPEYPCGAGCGNLLGAWARGLARWGREVCVRAAVSAARVALPVWEGANIRCTGFAMFPAPREPRRAIEAAEAWLACPCKEHEEAWHRAHGDWTVTRSGHWIPSPDETLQCLAQRPERAARLASEAAVRDAIREALVPWALGPLAEFPEEGP